MYQALPMYVDKLIRKKCVCVWREVERERERECFKVTYALPEGQKGKF